MCNDFDERMRKARRRGEIMSRFVVGSIAICILLTILGFFVTAYVLQRPEIIGEYFSRMSAGAQTPCAKTTLPIGVRSGHI